MTPKFRAWDKVEERWIDIKHLGCFDDGELWYLQSQDANGADCDPPYFENELGVTWDLMQYTGLKGYMDDSFDDNEEKEVYQGDIIDIFWEEYLAGYYQENHMVGVVDLDETGTAWIIKNGKYDWHNPTPIPIEANGMSISRSLPNEEDLEEVFLHNFYLTSSDITILGNIHENPELLKEDTAHGKD